MKEEKVYGIINWTLLPFSALLALLSIVALVMGLMNPILLFVAIILICVLCYTFFSIRFFRKNIIVNLPAKPNLRSWITFTGFVTGFFVFNLIFSCVKTLSDKSSLLQNSQNAMDKLQPQIKTMQSLKYDVSFLNVDAIYHFAIVINICFLAYGLLLLLHLMMSFSFLRRYKYLFKG